MSQKTGTSMSYDTSSARYRRRRAAKRRAEERSWAARSGPVVILHLAVVVADGQVEDYAPNGAAGSASFDKPGA
jgi:hypothetical protein